MCKIKTRILISALAAQTLVAACHFYIISHTNLTEVPQPYKKRVR